MKNSKLTISLLLIFFTFGAARAQTGANLSKLTIRAEALNDRGVEKADAGKYAEAIELFRQAIRLCPDYAIAYGNLGGTLYLDRQLEEAVVVLEKAIGLNPDFPEAYSRLGITYADLGEPDKAVETLKRAVKIRPDFAMAHHNLGCIYNRQKKFKEAFAALERAASLNPNNAETYVQSGFAAIRLKKYGEAIKQIEKAVSLKPQDSEAQYFLGQLYFVNRDKQSALAQYRKITLLDSQLANKLYAVIYSNLLVTVKDK